MQLDLILLVIRSPKVERLDPRRFKMLARKPAVVYDYGSAGQLNPLHL